MMKIMISGGHLTPALAFMEDVLKNHPDDELVFVGREYSQPGQISQERQEVTARSVRFVALAAPKAIRADWLGLAAALPRLGIAVWRAGRILAREQPQVLLSFGSYLAVPLSLAAKIKGVPIVTHEQTRRMGVANRLISRVASRVALTYAQTSLPHGGADKVVVTGSPLRAGLLKTAQAAPSWLGPDSRAGRTGKTDKPLLYVTGGSQGSAFINQLVARHLTKLCQDWVVIHQAGNPRRQAGRLLRQAQKDELPQSQSDGYYLRSWLSVEELAWVYRHASGVISRAGANTTLELHYLAVPSILIPLPHSRWGEQQANAEALRSLGGALVLDQLQLKDESFWQALDELRQHHGHMKEALRRQPPQLVTTAASALYQLLQDVHA